MQSNGEALTENENCKLESRRIGGQAEERDALNSRLKAKQQSSWELDGYLASLYAYSQYTQMLNWDSSRPLLYVWSSKKKKCNEMK